MCTQVYEATPSAVTKMQFFDSREEALEAAGLSD
jgi:hypothetical protein